MNFLFFRIYSKALRSATEVIWNPLDQIKSIYFMEKILDFSASNPRHKFLIFWIYSRAIGNIVGVFGARLTKFNSTIFVGRNEDILKFKCVGSWTQFFQIWGLIHHPKKRC